MLNGRPISLRYDAFRDWIDLDWQPWIEEYFEGWAEFAPVSRSFRIGLL